MCQTLFFIPTHLGGFPLFGWGILLAAWGAASAALLVFLIRRGNLAREGPSLLPVVVLLGAAIFFLPRLFPDGVPIRGYGVMLLLGVVAGVWLSAHRARRMGFDPEMIVSLAFWLFISGIVGARFFHVVEYWNSSYYHPGDLKATIGAILNIPNGGLVVYGSLIGGLGAFFLFVRRHKLPALAIGDIIVPGVVLGMALGRIGCLMNGCCYGGPSDAPWAVTFPQETPPYAAQVLRGERHGFLIGAKPSEPRAGDGAPVLSIALDSPAAKAGLKPGDRIAKIGGRTVKTNGDAHEYIAAAYFAREPLLIETSDGRRIAIAAVEIAPRSLPVHPTQVYSAVNNILLCLVLLAWYPYRRRDGEVLALFFTLYPISRFVIEIIRTDEPSVFSTGLSISQNVSLLALVGAAAFWAYLLWKRPRVVEA